MSKRKEWEFGYSADKVASGAEEQLKHRQSRREFWQEQYDKYLQEVREKGIEVSESAAMITGGTGAYSSGYGPQVMIGADYQRKLSECFNKVREHSVAAAEYQAWIKMLRSLRPDHHLELDFSDWDYFFSAYEVAP